MQKRRTKKVCRTIDKTLLQGKLQLAARTCAVTLVFLMTSAALTFVCYQAEVSGYISEETMLSVRQTEPLQTEIYLLGDAYVIDWSSVNEAVGMLQPYFALIPAPMRLPYQLMLFGEERYQEAQKEQRAREFIENI